MPLYEYTCKKCNHEFEELVSGDQTVSCPACGSKKVARKLSTFAALDGNAGKNSGSCSDGSCATGNCPFA